ncbi:hypothetical protein TRFO_08542 [Tritrichomonas foetus]|uniref:Uncharacterized protein n=1 Tax=Tritrichomonas foetus TaxID=1144522 RepID=A0A1J4JP31_9EUKA|nr:hypothetical protein TRFO_08542 [Tritrichomonas foetus]|eukprot:OHS99275.1 hypothetical protein TRFO_08542 [Tritrichomonas foetus]
MKSSTTEMTSSGHMSSSDNFTSLSNSGYGGMIEKSSMKKLRNLLFFYFNYVDFLDYNFKIMHKVVTIFRLLQFLGSSFLSGSNIFWVDGTVSKKAVSILSVFWYILPPEYRDDYGCIVVFLYTALFLLYYILIYAAAFYLKNSGKVSNKLCVFTLIFSGTFGYLYQPIVSEFCGELILNMINNRTFDVSDFIAIATSFVCFAAMFGLLKKLLEFQF